ncbi:YgfZ/GcvT domain-containing protein [Altericista sp. CCNU0014]|uniref:CAF17-like 4Fe-4S cluster assembly/insertion protein YgfZ n=1 Tax=Altericista sp. CCNU0014 TaxID=3082949 RepID=UPI00384BBAF1
MQALRDYQRAQGAQLEASLPVTFGNDVQAIAAVDRSVAIYDRSHWGRLRLGGGDRLTFLHNQSTNDLKRLQPGQGCETVILTSTARTIDLVSAYVTEAEILLLTSPNRRQQLLTWLDRYIFFGDKVELTDLSDSTACFSLLGPDSTTLLQNLGATDLPQTLDSHTTAELSGLSVRIAAGSGLSAQGYTLITDRADGAALWAVLAEAKAIPLGERAWEQLRVLQGRPVPEAELTEDYNPLEAGLWDTVSFNKGCYIGQETIARLNTYNGVKQQLWGLKMSRAAQPGTPLFLGEQKVGVLTSAVATADGFFGLGYLKTKAGGAGLTVSIDGFAAVVADVPFLSRLQQSAAMA